MDAKKCPDCGRVLAIEEFMRRTGQPWHLPPRSHYAVATEPLIPKVEEGTCNHCFMVQALRDSRAADERKEPSATPD